MQELCGRILEEKERLSINSRSRDTSVNTSRVASPSGERKSNVVVIISNVVVIISNVVFIISNVVFIISSYNK